MGICYISTARLLAFLFFFTVDLTVVVTAQENSDDSCGNPDASSQILADSIPSLQYNIDESDNDDEQKARKAKDFEVYFSAYGELHHQKDMLTDMHRMESYYTAISANAEIAFKDKIVMDVGTGSGVLAIWAAKAGAKKVYAIEYTSMAKNAIKLVEANGVSDIVTVIQGTVEGVKLPLEEDGFVDDGNEQVVDVIVSEWMGYMLIRESMLDSVLVARDRYLRKDTGIMLPSHASILLAPVMDEDVRLNNIYDYNQAMFDWYDFIETTEEKFGVSYIALTEEFQQEQMDYYIHQSQWAELKEEALLAKPQVLKTLDLMTCTHKDTRGIFDGASITDESIQLGNIDTNEFDFVLQPETGIISGFASWFTTDFKSRTDSFASDGAPKLIESVTLNTGPEQGYTHWGQQVFYFLDAIHVKSSLEQVSMSLREGQIYGETTTVHIKGKLDMFRTKSNARLYKCRIEYFLEEVEKESQEAVRKTHIVDQVFDIP